MWSQFLFYLFEEGDLSLGDFESGGGIGIENTEGNIVEAVSGGVEGQGHHRNETDNGDLFSILK